MTNGSSVALQKTSRGVESRRVSTSREDLQPLLTLQEVARVLAVSPRTVRRLLSRGLPHVRIGRVLRFDPVDVGSWVEARKE